MCQSIERYYQPIYRPILDTIYPHIGRFYWPLLSTDPRYYRPMYRPIYWLILDPIHRYIDRHQILSTDTRYYWPMYRPMYRQMHRPILEHLSTARVSVECRPMYELKYWWSIGAVSVKYWWSIGEPPSISTDRSIGRYIGRYSIEYRSLYWLIYRPMHRWWPPHKIHDPNDQVTIIHQSLTTASLAQVDKALNWLESNLFCCDTARY